MTQPEEYPACWSWPVRVEHLDRSFLAARNDPGRDGKLALVRDWQDGRCGICGGHARRLVNDHDHDTGYYRGKLCDSCNNREGGASENYLLFARYRFRHPTVILGVRIYWAKPDSARVILAELGPDPMGALRRWMDEHDPLLGTPDPDEAPETHQEATDPARRR